MMSNEVFETVFCCVCKEPIKGERLNVACDREGSKNPKSWKPIHYWSTGTQCMDVMRAELGSEPVFRELSKKDFQKALNQGIMPD